MCFDPLFDTKITRDDISNIEFIESEWDRYLLYLPTKAALLATFQCLKPRNPDTETPSIHTPLHAPVTTTAVECTIDGSVCSKTQYFYRGEDNDCLDDYYLKGVELPPYETSPSLTDKEVVAIEPCHPNIDVLHMVGNILADNRYIDLSTSASLSVAINRPLTIRPIAGTVVKVSARSVKNETFRRPNFGFGTASSSQEKPRRHKSSAKLRRDYERSQRKNLRVAQHQVDNRTITVDNLVGSIELVTKRYEIKPKLVSFMKDLSYWQYDLLCQALDNPTFAKWYFLYYTIMQRSDALRHHRLVLD